MKQNCKITVTIEFFVQNGPWNTSHMTPWGIVGLVTFFFYLTLTLIWAKYENCTQSIPLPGPWEYLWKVLGEKCKLVVSTVTWIHPILTFDLTLTWHVTSILNFRECFRGDSSRSFEFRLAHLSATIRFRDSRGSDPTPQEAVVGTETAQAVAG